MVHVNNKPLMIRESPHPAESVKMHVMKVKLPKVRKHQFRGSGLY